MEKRGEISGQTSQFRGDRQKKTLKKKKRRRHSFEMLWRVGFIREREGGRDEGRDGEREGASVCECADERERESPCIYLPIHLLQQCVCVCVCKSVCVSVYVMYVY